MNPAYRIVQEALTHGLIGIYERAALVDGELEHGAHVGRVFRVAALLPC